MNQPERHRRASSSDVAHKLDFGTFKDFTGKGAATKEALTNWGIAAVIYLVVGRVLRPDHPPLTGVALRR